MRKRLVAVVAGTLIAAFWASPAYAMSDPVFVQAPGSGAVAQGSETIRVEAKPGSVLGLGLEEVTIRVTVSPRPGTGGGPISLGEQKGGVFQGTWNAGAAPYNGAYDIHATASSSSDTKSASVTNVLVNNRPAVPSGVKATLKDGVPSITWAPNPERDITGYKVVRLVDGGSPAQVYSGQGTSATDTSAPHSKGLTYRVAAVRKSPTSDAGVESSLSAATAPVTIPAPPAEQAPGAPAGAAAPADPNRPTIPGTNIVTGKETPKPPVPGANKSFGKAVAPIVKAAPPSTAFDETLPYSGVPPQQFEAAGDEPSPLDAQAQSEQAADEITVTNPARFIFGGILLMIASAFMWRTSRRLLRSTKLAGGSPPTVKYPSFRINRG